MFIPGAGTGLDDLLTTCARLPIGSTAWEGNAGQDELDLTPPSPSGEVYDVQRNGVASLWDDLGNLWMELAVTHVTCSRLR